MGTPSSDAKLRTWFLRNLLEAAERELSAGSVAQLPERAPARLRPLLSLDRLRTAAALDTIPLDEGEEAILAFEQALGDRSGRTLERIACEMLARQLVQAAAAVRVGDLFGTVARLRAPLEHPFVDAEVLFELARTPTGFRLTIGIPGRPRATRVLAHVAAGAVQAAERFARESHVEPLRLNVETFADRARVDAHFRRPSAAPPAPDPVPASRRSSGTSRLLPSLSAEVARILDSSLGVERTRSEEPARRSNSAPPPPPSEDVRPAPETPKPQETAPRSTRPPPVR